MSLMDSSVRNSLIIECISDYIWEVDLIENNVYVSDSWSDFLGYDKKEVENIAFWYSIIHPEDRDSVENSMECHKTGKKAFYEAQYRIKTKNKGYKWVLSRAKASFNEKGQATYIAGLNVDISSLKATEESANKYHTLFNTINDGVFLSKIDKETFSDEFIEVNDAAAEMLGCTKEDLIGKAVNDIKQKEFHHDTIIANKMAFKFGSHTKQATIISRKKGLVPVEVNIHNFKKDDEYFNVSVVRDISERIKAQEQLRESEERYKSIVELSPSGIFIVEEGKIIFVNDNGVKLLGVESKEALIGKPINELIQLEFDSTRSSRAKLVTEGNVAPLAEIKFIKADGTIIDCEIKTIPMIYKGKICGLSFCRDITEHKKIEAENKKLLDQTIEYDRFKTEFFSNISHELRTPLNIIISSIQLINESYKECDKVNNKCHSLLNKYMGVMKQNSYRLLKLINNIIDLTRIDTGFYNMNFKNHNIVEILEEVTLSVVPYVESKGIEIIFDTDMEEKIIACDADKIERILLNLLSNAIKFTKASGRIKVNIGEKDEKVIISVRDSGSGIPEEKFDLIFERFRQVDEVLTKRAEGSGIGLSLVKALVTAHDGTIRVTSKVGEGSEFLVELPVKVVEESNEKRVSVSTSNLEQNKLERINIEFSDIYL